MSKISVAALIVNWNGAGDTLELIASLASCVSEDLAISCVVVDNASASSDRDSLRAGLQELSQRVPISAVWNSINAGVPAAYNQAIQSAGLTHDYYLRLDNDTTVERAGLNAMVVAMERDDSIGAVGGNVKFYHDRSRDNGGAVTIDLVRGRTSVAYPGTDTVCDGVLGCIMLVRADAVRRYVPEVFLGKLFLCTDESELSLRLARDHLTTFYVHQRIGYHKGGASTSKVQSLSQYYSIRNWTYLRLAYTTGAFCKAQVWAEIVARTMLNVVRWRAVYLRGVVSGVAMWRNQRSDERARTRYGHVP